MPDHSDENPPNSTTPDDGASPDERRQRLRVVLTAAGCLIVFAAAMYGMKALTAGATVIVEADELATVYMTTGGIKLREVDGPMVLTLHPGRNAVRAGKFRVTDGFEGARLEYSTGEVLEIRKDDEIRMEIRSFPIE